MAAARERLLEGRPLRRSLSGGRIHIDRPLPFLVVHRRRPGDAGTPKLLYGQGSYLIAGPDMPAEDLRELMKSVISPLADRFGSFLVIELWGASSEPAPIEIRSPTFRVTTRLQEGEVPTTTRTLQRELHDIDVLGERASVEVDHEGSLSPEGLESLLDQATSRELGCFLLGLEVPAIYRDPEGTLYPEVLRTLTRDLSEVLHKVAFAFAQLQTRFEPEDFRALGRRAVLAHGWEMDRRLTQIGQHLDFLLNVTPLNTASSWEQFQVDGFRRAPVFHYRPLAFDPDLVKRELFDIEVEKVEDPTLAYLLRSKRNEIDRLVTMLEDRESSRFLQGSIALYGTVEDELYLLAQALLSQSSPEVAGDEVEPARFATRAAEELERYRAVWPELQADVEIRDDIPGVMVVHGTLMIGSDVRIGAHRVEPLIHHEVGTHIVTAQNGRAQPLSLLSVGLPGYEETQEGLAVLAEYAVGGLGIDRLRILAGRVVAVRKMVDGRRFVEVFRELVDKHGFEPRQAWQMTMRVYRGGGLTKDAVYLRGLTRLLGHLAEGGPLDPLFVGKMPLEHVPLIEELLWREVLDDPPLRPLWLQVSGAQERLDSARRGVGLLDLVSA